MTGKKTPCLRGAPETRTAHTEHRRNKQMKKVMVLLMVVAIGLTTFACSLGSIVGRGEVETRSFDFSGFTRVEVSSTFDAEIVRGDIFSITVTTNQNIFDYLALERDSDTLKIKLKAGSYTVASLKARVTMPDLTSLNVSGASEATANGFSSSHNLDLMASGASRIELTDIKCANADIEVSGASRVTGSLESGDAKVDISGASTIDVSGRGGKLDLTASGASHASFDDFTTADTRVNFSGASSGNVKTSGKLDVQLSGASSLKYFGNPTLGDINVTGASSISKG
jgi:hypothetical protein